MEHVFQNPDANGNPKIRGDLDGLGLPSARGIKISVSVNKPFFFQQVQVLAYGGKSHLKILDDLHFGSLVCLVYILVNLGAVYFL